MNMKGIGGTVMKQLNKKGNKRGMHDNHVSGVNNNKYKHGLSDTSLFSTFQHIKERCYKEYSKSYVAYGAKGVRIYSEWLDDFELFYKYCIDNGWYKGCHISRNDDIGNYEPGNIQFKTPYENRREAGIIHGKTIRCINNGMIFESVKDAARWVKESQNLDSKLKTITENIRGKGLRGSISYGFSWEVV